MKSKPQSAHSKPSTPNPEGNAPSLPQLKKRLHLAIAILPLALAACSSSPESETGAPPQPQTEAPAESAITQTLALQTPTPAWTLAPSALHRLPDGTYLCIHRLTAPQGMAAQMISTAQTTFSFQHAGNTTPSIKHYVLGKTWNWDANPEITFVDSLDELKDALAEAQSVPFTTP
ncbi:hypothetical protein [Pelagicoccus mobilis]|uniref:Uncharacterized protein n=1 Tax=Pelagicoccus mobilis TaxID=415221 RepID=A0A934RSE4_9BACT|nr:hypothetical protein [Pelagicoccus mobilis]MBK1875548.1 hypothetical protein [Pelagicoccus mobilis]